MPLLTADSNLRCKGSTCVYCDLFTLCRAAQNLHGRVQVLGRSLLPGTVLAVDTCRYSDNQTVLAANAACHGIGRSYLVRIIY